MNFIAASGDTVPQANDADSSDSLKSRVLSALILAPAVLAAIYLGGPVYDLLIVCAVVIMAWEWRRLCADGYFDASGIIFACAVGGASIFASFDLIVLAILSIAIGALIVFLLTIKRAEKSSVWTIGGIIAVGVTGISLILLREIGGDWSLTLWFIVAIWATDVFAFFVGRTVGGPKLAPRISPGKTWSGLIGGVMGAMFWSVLWALWTGADQAGTSGIESCRGRGKSCEKRVPGGHEP